MAHSWALSSRSGTLSLNWAFYRLGGSAASYHGLNGHLSPVNSLAQTCALTACSAR